jgi:Skp family chaperone for outer membrane proteins
VLNVRKSHLLAILAASVLSIGLVAAYGVAQQPGRTAMRPPAAAPNVPNIALLDVSAVFKNHSRFKAMMEQMKADVQQAETHVKQDQEAIRKLAEQLQQYRKGTPEYQQLSEAITKRKADLTVKVQLQKDDFLQREAKIYHNVYHEVQQEVDYVAAAHGISVVLRFSGDAVDPAKPETVIRGINRPVVWYAKNLDITPVILERLNARALPNNAAPPGSARRSPHGVNPRR